VGHKEGSLLVNEELGGVEIGRSVGERDRSVTESTDGAFVAELDVGM